jgi:hypothetical protein
LLLPPHFLELARAPKPRVSQKPSPIIFWATFFEKQKKDYYYPKLIPKPKPVTVIVVPV